MAGLWSDWTWEDCDFDCVFVDSIKVRHNPQNHKGRHENNEKLYVIARALANSMRSETFARWTVNGNSTLSTKIDKFDLLRFTPKGR